MLGAIAEGTALLAYSAARGPKPGLATVAKLGALNFLSFHHVTLLVRTTDPLLQAAGLGSGTISLSLALMSGTFLAMLLLAAAGHRVGVRAGGPRLERAIHGAKVGIPYGAIAVAVALLAKVSAGSRGSSPAIRASIPSAIGWPLALAVLAGLVGGALPEKGAARPEGRGDRIFRGALSGGAWMVGIAMVLAFAGLVALAPIKPDATRAYFAPFRQGRAEGVLLIGYTLLALPNLAAFVLFPSMGACLGFSASAGPARFSSCLLSYTHFPGQGPLDILSTGSLTAHPPAGYYLFVLAPLVAVLAGGAVAARRSGASSAGEGAQAGALAGIIYGLASLLLATLAGISVASTSGAVTFQLGVPVAGSAAIALVWGVLGGALGGALGRNAPSEAWPDTRVLPES